jgi:formate dehydrogenase major subunit
VGKDSVDFVPDKPPDYMPDWSKKPTGMQAIDGRTPFIMLADRKSGLFAPSGLKDGPLPTHYEPVESPSRNPMYAQQDNPAAKKWQMDDNAYRAVADPRYPYVMTTYRLTEHHSGAIPTRMVPTTAELQPEGFAELPPELAKELGVDNLDWVVVSTARGEIETKAYARKHRWNRRPARLLSADRSARGLQPALSADFAVQPRPSGLVSRPGDRGWSGTGCGRGVGRRPP